MFKSGFEQPANFLKMYEYFIDRKVSKEEIMPLISDFIECQKAFNNLQSRNRIE